jgi:GWxTD domain-containing protein
MKREMVFAPHTSILTLLFCAGLVFIPLHTAQSQSPMSPEIRAGFELVERGDLDGAEKVFNKIHDRNKKDVWAITGQGVVLLRRAETTTQVFEILLKLTKQDNTSKAIGKFRKALEIEPDFLDARYFLGRAHLNRRKFDDYVVAAAELSSIAQRDSVFRDALFQLGVAHLGMEKWDLALADFHAAQRLLPDDHRPGVKAAEALFELGDGARASESFLDNIGQVRNEEFLNDVFTPMRPLCTKSEVSEFEALPAAEKGSFIRRFWRKRNPTPGSAANERLHEHYRRLRFVFEAFHMPLKPYYDDRGKVYLRYGQPEKRYVSPTYSGNIKNNESWSYEHLQNDLVFDFIDNGGIFREADDLSAAAGPGTSFAQRYAIAVNLYADRSDLSPLYSRVAMTAGNTGESELVSRISEVSSARHAAEAAASREKFLYNYNARPLEFAFDWAGFRQDEDNTRQEIYFGVPAGQLGFRVQENGSLTSSLQCAVIVEDSLFDDVLQSTWSTQVVADDTAMIRSAYPLLQRNVVLPAGNYNLTLQIANRDGRRLGIYKAPLRVRSFAGEDLALSDVQFAFSVAPAPGDSGDFVKHRLNVRPYPFNTLNKSRPIYLYYEIYNLSTDVQNRNDYRVEYEARVVRQDRSFFKSIASIFGGGKKRGVASSLRQQGVGYTAREYLALDLANMPKGMAEISIRVTDERNGRTVEASRPLSLED